jgi:mRNA interferase HigB
MRVISKKKLREYWEKFPNAEKGLRAWYSEAKNAEWKDPAEIKSKYHHASILQNGRVVFNISGSKYRLIVQINFTFQIIYIRFIGSHKDYDSINAQTI